jgi:hypothetical protein
MPTPKNGRGQHHTNQTWNYFIPNLKEKKSRPPKSIKYYIKIT